MKPKPTTPAVSRPPVARATRAALAGLAALALACGGGADEADGGPDATPVEAAVARLDTLSLEVRAVGSLEADAQVEVKPETDGHVTSIHFREGERVEEGDVLVRLDENKLQAQVEAARATVQRTRAEVENLARSVERNDSLLARGAISEQAFDDLQTEYASARARLEEARANLNLAEQRLEDATVRAPFGGRVGARSFDRGDYLRIGDPMFTVVDDQPLEIGFSVPERYLGQLDRGSPVSLTVRSMPGRTVRGEVSFVSPYVDPQSRTVSMKARVPNPGSELRAGQFADVRLQLESRPAVVVPEAAVVPREGGNVAFVVEGGEARRREVRTGARRPGLVEVLSGVEAGDTVVVAGQQNLQEGSAVEVQLRGSAEAGDGDAAAPEASSDDDAAEAGGGAGPTGSADGADGADAGTSGSGGG